MTSQSLVAPVSRCVAPGLGAGLAEPKDADPRTSGQQPPPHPGGGRAAADPPRPPHRFRVWLCRGNLGRFVGSTGAWAVLQLGFGGRLKPLAWARVPAEPEGPWTQGQRLRDAPCEGRCAVTVRAQGPGRCEAPPLPGRAGGRWAGRSQGGAVLAPWSPRGSLVLPFSSLPGPAQRILGGLALRPQPSMGRGLLWSQSHLSPMACRGRQEPSYWRRARSMLGRSQVSLSEGTGVEPDMGSFPAQPRSLCGEGTQSWPVPSSDSAPSIQPRSGHAGRWPW